LGMKVSSVCCCVNSSLVHVSTSFVDYLMLMVIFYSEQNLDFDGITIAVFHPFTTHNTLSAKNTAWKLMQPRNLHQIGIH